VHLFLSYFGSVRVKKLIFAVMQTTFSVHSLSAANSLPEIGIVRLLKVGNKLPKKRGKCGKGKPAAVSLPWGLSRNVFMGVAGKWQMATDCQAFIAARLSQKSRNPKKPNFINSLPISIDQRLGGGEGVPD